MQMRAWCVDDEANAQFDAALADFRAAKNEMKCCCGMPNDRTVSHSPNACLGETSGVGYLTNPAKDERGVVVEKKFWVHPSRLIDFNEPINTDGLVVVERADTPTPYHVTINGQYAAASHCVTTTHGETLVAFETDAGSLAPLDGKQVSVTIQATESKPPESKEPK